MRHRRRGIPGRIHYGVGSNVRSRSRAIHGVADSKNPISDVAFTTVKGRYDRSVIGSATFDVVCNRARYSLAIEVDMRWETVRNGDGPLFHRCIARRVRGGIGYGVVAWFMDVHFTGIRYNINRAVATIHCPRPGVLIGATALNGNCLLPAYQIYFFLNKGQSRCIVCSKKKASANR